MSYWKIEHGIYDYNIHGYSGKFYPWRSSTSPGVRTLESTRIFEAASADEAVSKYRERYSRSGFLEENELRAVPCVESDLVCIGGVFDSLNEPLQVGDIIMANPKNDKAKLGRVTRLTENYCYYEAIYPDAGKKCKGHYEYVIRIPSEIIFKLSVNSITP